MSELLRKSVAIAGRAGLRPGQPAGRYNKLFHIDRLFCSADDKCALLPVDTADAFAIQKPHAELLRPLHEGVSHIKRTVADRKYAAIFFNLQPKSQAGEKILNVFGRVLIQAVT